MLPLFDSVPMNTGPLSQPCFPKCGHIPLIGILDTAALLCSALTFLIPSALQLKSSFRS